jgi:hypothetical protein
VARKLRSRKRIITKAINTEVHTSNINREDGFSLSRSTKTLIRDLREFKQPLNNQMISSIWPWKRQVLLFLS